jgi:bacteriorhodopsin
VLLAIPPLIALTSSDSAGDIIWSLVVIGGAVPASYVIAQRAPGTVQFIFLCLATGGVVGTLILLISVIGEVDDLAKKKVDFLDVAGSDTLALVETFLVLWPGYYMVEEVLFRGSIDSHVHHPASATAFGRRSSSRCCGGFGTFQLLSAKVRSRR